MNAPHCQLKREYKEDFKNFITAVLL